MSGSCTHVHNWPTIAAKYFLHSVMGSLGVLVIIFALEHFLPPWVDHTINSYPGFTAPSESFQSIIHVVFYSGIFILGFVLGGCINFYSKSNLAKWAWVLPTIWLTILMIIDIPPYHQEGTFHALRRDFLSEDPEQALTLVLGSWPFLASIGYSVGGWIVLRRSSPEIDVVSKAMNA